MPTYGILITFSVPVSQAKIESKNKIKVVLCINDKILKILKIDHFGKATLGQNGLFGAKIQSTKNMPKKRP